MYVYACMYACMIEGNRAHDQDRHTNGTHDHRKREDSGKAEKPAYIGIIAGNEKKYKKS